MGALLFTLLGVALDVTSSSWPVNFRASMNMYGAMLD